MHVHEEDFINHSIKYRADVDGLRAIAVLLVIFHHFEIPLFSGGYIGVDIFFVISGYLITAIINEALVDNNFSLAKFYQRRVRRILPALFLVAAVAYVGAMMLMLHYERSFFAESAIASVASLSNIFFWRNLGYFDGGADENPLLHTWSLSVEEQFYMVFPVFLLLVHKFMRDRLNQILLLLFVASLIFSSIAAFVRPTASFFLPMSRAFELIAGAFLVHQSHRCGAIRRPAVFVAAGIAMIAFAAAFYESTTPFPGLAALLPLVGTMMVIAGGYRPNQVSALMENPIFVGIGKISYSMYLWHWPLIVFFKYYEMRPVAPVEYVAMFLLTLVLSALSYRYVEVPFRRGIKGASIRTDFVAAGTTALVFVAVSLFVIVNHGFPDRSLQELTRMQEDLGQQKLQVCNFKDGDNIVNFDIAKNCLLRTAEVGGHRKALLWGDSYANHYKDAIAASQFLPDTDIYTITKPGCPPFLKIATAFFATKAKSQCDEFNQFALMQIRKLDINTVILSANWWSYSRDPNFFEQIRSVVQHLLEGGAEVIVIGASPIYRTRVPHIIARDAKFGNGSLREYKIQFDHRLDNGLEAAISPAGLYFSPYRMWCSGEVCRFRDDGGVYQVDHGHLSRYAASMVIEQISKTLPVSVTVAR